MASTCLEDSCVLRTKKVQKGEKILSIHFVSVWSVLNGGMVNRWKIRYSEAIDIQTWGTLQSKV